MGDDNVLDQNEIERLLGGGAGGAPPPSAPAPAADTGGGVLDQSELDALFGGGAAAPASPAPTSPTPAGPLDQSDIESLFGGGGEAAPANDGGALGQSDIESLFGGGGATPTPPKPASAAPTAPRMPQAPAAPAAPFQPPSFGGAPPMGGGIGGGFGGPVAVDDFDDDDGEDVPRGDLNYLMKRADDSLRSIASSKMDLPTEVIEFQFPEFGGTVPSTEHATLDQISEVELDVKIELGRTEMYLEDVLKLRKGSVVPLDKMAGDAVDIYVNGRLLARGEVLVMNENFCVRVAELLAGAIPME